MAGLSASLSPVTKWGSNQACTRRQKSKEGLQHFQIIHYIIIHYIQHDQHDWNVLLLFLFSVTACAKPSLQFKPWISLDDSAIDQKSGNAQHIPHDALEKMIKHKCCPHVDLGWSWMILLPTSANDETEEFEGNGVPCYRKFWKKNREIFWNLPKSNSSCDIQLNSWHWRLWPAYLAPQP